MTSIGLKPGSEEYKILVKLKRILVKLSPEAIMAFMYIWDNISVGEILFERDLIQLYNIKRFAEIVETLKYMGLIERGEGCYNLARWLRNLRRKIGGSHELRSLLERVF